MDFMIVFFRDILDGPLYIVVASICSILICSCIGYLGERYLNDKKTIMEKTASKNEVTGRAAFDAANAPKENAQEVVQNAVAPASEQSSEAASIEVLKDEEGDELLEEEIDPNANVNYNITSFGSDKLLDDD